ncbi:hypothetical protein K466DRAFT_658632 [Polyporus arcularius HHB13444]|uniref:Uncharacterized protein n=1 Tax=Polyporus arcularius HHB13444 TaxID=1314778 RepID=A0A5C3PU26_9APHY|nr:hypothetical protein K466DRAFT_658632 [Polyporus arcularius HHB13444]
MIMHPPLPLPHTPLTMAALCYVQLERLLEGCKGIRVIANRWAYAAPFDTHALVMWYPFRCVEVDGDRAAPLAVALDGGAFPVGSYAVDKSLRRILCRKDSRGWYRTDEPVTSWGVLTAELEIVYQERYKPRQGETPTIPPVWFNTPLPEAKLGNVEDPNSAAFGGKFADPKQAKFMVRLLLPGKKQRDIKQYNLHRCGKPIPRHELGEIVSGVVEGIMEGGPLQVNGKDVMFEELILVDVHCVSVGSVQVTLATKYYSNMPLL